MGGVSIGSFVLSADRASVLAGLVVLVIVTWLIGRKIGPAINLWASGAAIGAAVTARLGFVAQHASVYLAEPLTVFAFWQGGFSPLWGGAGFALVSVWHLWRKPDMLLPLAGSAVIAFASWSVVHQLVQGVDMAMPETALLLSLGGDPVLLESVQGRPMVINLWATWCPPCRREMPMMADVATMQTGADLHFVNQGESAEAVRRYLSQAGIIISPIMDPGSEMMRYFGALGLPTTLFIDASGQLSGAHMGEISRAQLLTAIQNLKDSN